MSTNAINSVAFIYHRFDMGGIETLILRLADFYIKSGLKVILFTRKGDLLPQLNSEVEVVLFDKYKELNKSARRLDSTTSVISFDPVSYMVMRKMQALSWMATRNRPAGRTGVFHPRAWNWPNDNKLFQLLVRGIFHLSPDHLFFYMSQAVMDETRTRLNLKRTIESAIIRLPIDTRTSYSWKPGVNNLIRVVSVGRLVHAKSYNRAIPKIVSDLAKLGLNVEWDIWGDGEDKSIIDKSIADYSLQNKVFTKGVLPYSNFQKTVCNYDIFVGMGTALLEAAALGIPSVCAVDFRYEDSLGFLHAAPIDSIGEEVAGAFYTPIGNLICDYSRLEKSKKIELGLLCKAASQERSNPSSYMDMIDSPKWPSNSLFKEFLIQALALPYLLALDARKFRSFIKSLVRYPTAKSN